MQFNLGILCLSICIALGMCYLTFKLLDSMERRQLKAWAMKPEFNKDE